MMGAAVERLDGEGLGLANVSTGTLIFGGVAAAAGVVVFLTTGGSPVSVGASAGPGGVSLSATGKF